MLGSEAPEQPAPRVSSPPDAGRLPAAGPSTSGEASGRDPSTGVAAVLRHPVTWVSAIVVVGLVLRLWRLTSLGDLDFDEQASAFIGSMAPAAMLEYLSRAPFEHPPLFYLVFHVWLAAFGSSEVAMRLFALVPGTALIAVVWGVVSRVAGARGGLVAALVVALSPLQVFESRDARMYTLLAAFMAGIAASFVWLGVAVGSRSSVRGVLGAAAGTGFLSLLALATHYYALFGVVGAALGFRHAIGTASVRYGSYDPALKGTGPEGRTRHPLWPWVAGLVLGAGLLGGWLLLAPGLRLSLTVAYPRFVEPRALLDAVLQSFGAHVVGPLASPQVSAEVGIGVVLGVAACAWVALRPARDDGSDASTRLMAAVALGGFLVTSLGVPALMILGRAYAPRFVALATPFLAILLGCALARLRWRWTLPVVAVYAATCIVFLYPMLTGYVRSDYGQALAALRSEVREDDAIVLNGPWQDLLYRRYGRGLPPGTIIASSVPLQPAEAVGWLQRLTASHRRLWVVDSATDAADPDGVVAGWLEVHAYPRPVMPYDKALLRPFLTDYSGAPPLDERPTDAAALGVRVTSVAAERWALEPGGETRLKIRAERTGRQGVATVALRRMAAELIGPDGGSVWTWDGPLTQVEGGLEYRAAVAVPPGAVTGSYTLRSVVYLARPDEAGRRVITRVSEPLPLARFEIGRG